MGLLSLFGCKPKENKPDTEKPTVNASTEDVSTVPESMSYEEQIEIFKSLGYEFADGVTKDLILTDGYAPSMWEEIRKERLEEIEQNPFSLLYYYFGWRSSEVPNFNFSDKCIWYDLEFVDPSDEYIWFMERMGVITNGEINFSDISLQVDQDNYEWIVFKVNGIDKKWKLEEVGYIADSFFQRFSYLPTELNTKGRYTIYDDGGQQFVIDYATETEQSAFIKKTGLDRIWLGEGYHFSEPED